MVPRIAPACALDDAQLRTLEERLRSRYSTVLQILLDTITFMSDEFEWDRKKAAANFKKHGVRFEQAVLAFEDAFALVELDNSEDFGEDRFLLTGRVADGILVVVYTGRGERIRIISAREATEYERRNYYRAAQED